VAGGHGHDVLARARRRDLGQRLEVAEQALGAYLAYAPRHGEPSHAAAHYRLGTIHARRGDVARARAAYEAALALDPGLAPARTALEGLR
jgi:tetratricopeptide (TPR) repeat protein